MVRKTSLILGATLAVLASLLAPGSAAACDGHLGARWSGFQNPLGDLQAPFFYFASEAAGSVPVVIRGVGDDCNVPQQPIVVGWAVDDPAPGAPRPATAGLDYQTQTGSSSVWGFHGPGPQTDTRFVNLVDDVLPEAVAEQARAHITLSSGRIEQPSDVPLWIIDNEGVSRIAFEPLASLEQSETYSGLSIAVLRAGPATQAEEFAYSVAGSGARPATPQADFTVTPPTIAFGPGDRVKLLRVAIVNDKEVEGTEELTITLTNPGVLGHGEPTTATVRILDNEEGQTGGGEVGAPSSRFHHPRHRHRYARADYRLREFHVFSDDVGVAGVAAVEIALLQKLKGAGRCRWFDGKRFRKGGCGDKRWLSTEYYPDLAWWYYRVPPLKPSVRTKVKHYVAYARGIDGADNVETTFTRKRNANRFEVLKKRR